MDVPSEMKGETMEQTSLHDCSIREFSSEVFRLVGVSAGNSMRFEPRFEFSCEIPSSAEVDKRTK
jgi:hypothetical protein